jgi:hypothetical protein
MSPFIALQLRSQFVEFSRFRTGSKIGALSAGFPSDTAVLLSKLLLSYFCAVLMLNVDRLLLCSIVLKLWKELLLSVFKELWSSLDRMLRTTGPSFSCVSISSDFLLIVLNVELVKSGKSDEL